MTATTTARTKSPVRRRLFLGLGVLLVLLIGYAVYAIARPTVLRTEIEIDATPEQVWKVLADRAAYPEWNPFIVSSAGELRAGATITNVLRDTNGKTTEFAPKLLAVDPGRELRWVGKIGVGGVFDGEHAFRIEALPGGRSRLVQEEVFRGVAVPFTTGMLRDTIEPQFHAMNRALAERAAR
ncbi:cyclase/dehydrase [Kribbella flavida DSM 17836]|uniref:Cyclase/dehydrase n=1 Tax=Kribbella flavida (strain DSM 17836 / JCM 10339 / NBRC 14399) TaxID=479435 RepID=D2Q341_KRIFD|nr:SRPBCC domain-containing protein [Kribbella flavida]ADB32166.1 cyclase/dehydrase [Kribbella flavida DSM 17836]